MLIVFSDNNDCVTSFCQNGKETINMMREGLEILDLVEISSWKLGLVLVTPVGEWGGVTTFTDLHCCCRLVNRKEPRSQTTMRRRSNDTTSCLPPVLQEDQNKQRSGRHENTDAHIFPPPVNFLLLLPTTLAHLSLSLSAASQSGRHALVAPL